MNAIYLDFNSTTPIDSEVVEEMMPFLRGTFGNPSSKHPVGIEAKMALEHARGQIADSIGAEPHEIVITSGGTESNNLAIQGAVTANRAKGNHIVTSSIEHPAVTEVCRRLEQAGFEISIVPVDDNGRLNPEEVAGACRPETVLVTVMLANNEIGTIQPIRRIVEVGHQYGALVHTDAAQAVGKIPVDVQDLQVDLLSLAGHKLYAPKGIGALFVKKETEIVSIMQGADHQQGLRPGTESVLLAAGLGKACEVSKRRLAATSRKMASLRDRLENRLLEELGPDLVRVNAKAADRLPNTSSVSFRNIDAAIILEEIGHRVVASAGAACHAETVELSPVLEAIRLSEDWAMGTIRFSTGRETKEKEIDEAAQLVTNVVRRLKPETGGSVADDAKDEINLTRYTRGMGCACKIRSEKLESILQIFAPSTDKRILVDMSSSDDAAVYEISHDVLLVQTVDFLTPIVDRPYDFGLIAAANSLSDIYAMGATPVFALNLVAFPTSRLPVSTLGEILRGAIDKCQEAGVSILGGHSIDDAEPKFGLVVTGTVGRSRLWTNAGACPGDALILTKPLGTGLIATGLKRGVVSDLEARAAARQMWTLNQAAAVSLKETKVHACTDVTGFGLLGHACEMMAASGVAANIVVRRVPVLAGAKKLARSGFVPSGTKANLSFAEARVEFDSDIELSERLVLSDAQTSGGLLVAVPAEETEKALSRLWEGGVLDCAVVGSVTEGAPGRIRVTA